MRFEYIDPFVESARATLSKVIQRPVEKGELRLETSPIPNQGVATIIGITGKVEGRVIFEMDQPTALRLAETMNGTVFETLTPLAMDTISELANMMIGGAVSVLNNQGFEFSVTPPTIFTGMELRSSDINLETLVIPLTTPHGNVSVNVALRIE